MSLDIGIDLGSAYIYVYERNDGIVLKEPAVVAYDRVKREVKAVGKEAFLLVGKDAGNVTTSYIYENNIYLEENIMLPVLEYIVKKVVGKIKLIRPRMCISVQGCADKELIKDCAFKAGVREAIVLESAFASAIGAKVDIKNTPGNIVVEIGEKLSDITVISYGEIILKENIDITCEYFDKVVSEHISKKHGVIIGKNYCSDIVNAYADFNSFAENQAVNIKGRHIEDGLLCELTIASFEIREKLIEVVDIIADKVKKISENIDDKIKDDILARGIILTGEGTFIPGFERLMEEKTGINTMLPDNAKKTAVTGTGIVLEYTGGNEL